MGDEREDRKITLGGSRKPVPGFIGPKPGEPKWKRRATTLTGLSAGRVATRTITFDENMYDEKNTQNTSYISRPKLVKLNFIKSSALESENKWWNEIPVKRSVDTLSDGRRTNAMNATHRAMPIASINSQWPVSIQTHTIVTEMVKLINSAGVQRPQIGPHGA